MNKILASILLFTIILFLMSFYALLSLVFGIQHSDKATIISGILSMAGGIAGAIGAYFIATYQLNKQLEHGKRKDQAQRFNQVKKTLMKLQLINDYCIRFVNSFITDFEEVEFNEEVNFKIKSSEVAISWIASNINNINDELLTEGFMMDYIHLNKLINHVYHEVVVFNNLPENQKPYNLKGLVNVMEELKTDLNRFEKYVEDELGKLKVDNF